MTTWLGSFDKGGSPVLKIRLSGPFTDGVEFEAIVDTGFTGFVSIPLVQAFPLGLILDGTTSVVLADGSTSINLVARGQVEVKGEKRVGTVLLDAGSMDVLLGMDFLRHFKRVLYIASLDFHGTLVT
jgi:clan AA aspartic protease